MTESNLEPVTSSAEFMGKSVRTFTTANSFSTQHDLAEGQLVRDVIYSCQGIDGEYIKLNVAQNEFEIDNSTLNATSGKSSRDLAQRLCELGKLYREVQPLAFQLHGQQAGLLAQAFSAAVHAELTEYFHFLAVLETKAHHRIPRRRLRPDSTSPDASIGKAPYLSLCRLSLLLSEPRSRLRILAKSVDKCSQLKGGGLAGALCELLQTGDPLQKSMVESLLQRCSAPLMAMVQRWVMEGELMDPFHEFFVASVPSATDDELWRHGYVLQKSMLPSFIPLQLGQLILQTGKSINFLRRCCHDEDWSTSFKVATAVVQAAQAELGQGKTQGLADMVEAVSGKVNKYLMKSLMEKFQFMEHCLALKRFLLLAQGDFIQYMMDRVGPELSRPAKQVSTFQLTSTLVSALSQSNAQYEDSDVQQRLHVKLMPAGPRDRGWHVFSLDYSVNPPLTAVLTAGAMQRYRHLFNFLWRLKRVEHSLSDTWKVLRELHRSPWLDRRPRGRGEEWGRMAFSARKSRGGKGEQEEKFEHLSLGESSEDASWLSGEAGGVEGEEKEEEEDEEGEAVLAGLVQLSFGERKKMDHFVMNLQSYITLEAVESSWQAFQASATAASGLEELISVHEDYLSAITMKAMLGPKSKSLLESLEGVFIAVLSMRNSCMKVHTHVQQVQAKKEEAAKKAAKRTAAGKWGSTSADGPEPRLSSQLLLTLKQEIANTCKQFSKNVKDFITKLPVEDNVSLHFLAFRLDFSKFYSQKA